MWMCDNARFTQNMYQDLAGADSYSCLLMHERMSYKSYWCWLQITHWFETISISYQFLVIFRGFE